MECHFDVPLSVEMKTRNLCRGSVVNQLSFTHARIAAGSKKDQSREQTWKILATEWLLFVFYFSKIE